MHDLLLEDQRLTHLTPIKPLSTHNLDFEDGFAKEMLLVMGGLRVNKSVRIQDWALSPNS